MAPPAVGGKGRVPREQWRSRSKKSAPQRLHRQKGRTLAANLEKVENMCYAQERAERDRQRLETGQAPAGHHNLPKDIVEAKARKAPAQKKKAPTGSKFPENTLIGLIKPEFVRKRLQELFAVEES
eukprot:TRINITY_DN1930_c0_g1_i1.p2 TRINITY_DN1930_c0_g1~~TRINITY_DN1930_c0_g1_i1.p2  ORF type:complete len:141 (+),score=68.55 TRINITY_DN1930_c0_g1_i1:48-425(+)